MSKVRIRMPEDTSSVTIDGSEVPVDSEGYVEVEAHHAAHLKNTFGADFDAPARIPLRDTRSAPAGANPGSPNTRGGKAPLPKRGVVVGTRSAEGEAADRDAFKQEMDDANGRTAAEIEAQQQIDNGEAGDKGE